MSTSYALDHAKLTEGPDQAPLFQLPTCRRDRRLKIARFIWHVSYLNACPNGCVAGNGFLGSMVGVAPDHLRTIRREAEDLGLVKTEIHNSNERTITPLVGIVALLRAGWIELAWVIAQEIQKAPSILKRLAATLLKSRGPQVDLSKLCRGLNTDSSEKSAPKSSGLLRGSLRGLSGNKERSEETTTSEATSQVRADAPKASSPDLPAAVLLLTQKAGLKEPEAHSLAATLTKIGATVGNIRHAVEVMHSRSNILNPGGFLVGAIRAALAGHPYLLPGSPAKHPSDLGERTQRLVKAPRPIPDDWLPGVPYEEARGYCNEAAKLLRLEGQERPADNEIRDRARQLWKRSAGRSTSPKIISRW